MYDINHYTAWLFMDKKTTWNNNNNKLYLFIY